MSVELSLHPYPRKWPKKPTIFKAKEKDEIYFKNFYDLYTDLQRLPRVKIPDTLTVWTGSDWAKPSDGRLPDSGNNYPGEEERVNYWKAGDVSRILKKHMKIWLERLKSDKEASEEESGYYWEYMKKLKKISAMKPSTKLIISFY